MHYEILHEVPGRIRVKLAGRVPEADLDALNRVLVESDAIERAVIYPRTASLAVFYASADPRARARALEALGAVCRDDIERARSTCSLALAPKTDNLLMDIACLVGGHLARRWFLPAPLAALYTVWSYRTFLREAIRSLANARLDVPVLDAAAIGISFVKRDFVTAAGTMLLLNLGELLEDYTRATSQNQLIYSLLDVPEYAQLIPGETRGCAVPRNGAWPPNPSLPAT